MAYEIQFARITNAGKLQDRFLTCQEIESEDFSKVGMGKVFTFLEILSPWFPTAQIGQLIITNFAKYYYEGGSTSDLVNFENALKNVNENLAQITQEGETDWIGNLNGLMMAIVGNNMHIAPSGQIEGYLFRDGKVNHLTEGLTDANAVHPLKTFSNIISGELKNQDKILIANKDLFNHISLDSIRQIVLISSPQEAALQISKILKKAKTKNVNVLIINLIPQEELSMQPISDGSNVYYLDKSTDSLLSKLSTFWRNLIMPVGKIITTKIKNVGKSPKLPDHLSYEKEKPKEEISKKTITDNNFENDRFHKEFLAEETRDDNLLKDEEINYSPELVHYYKKEELRHTSKEKNKILQILTKIINYLKNLILWLVNIGKNKSKRKYLYIAGAVLVILIIILYVSCNNNGSKVGNLDAQKILDEAYAAQNDGKKLLSDGNIDAAKTQLALAIEKAQTIQNNSFVAKDAKDLINSSNLELDKLTSTTRVSDSKPVNSISDPIKGVFIYSGTAYLITDHDAFSVNLIGGSPNKIGTLPKGNFVSGSKNDKSIYLYTSDQNMYTLDTSTNKISLTKTSSDTRWETANSIFFYSNSLYLLDGVLGQIYRHSLSQNQFGPGEEYTSKINNLQGTSSIAIDGSIYVLNSSGDVLKFQKSKLQSFSLKNIPTPFSSIKNSIKIFTDVDTPSIYILDPSKKRILEFDKDGQFLHQYALPASFDKLTDFAVSAKSRKIWVVNNNSLYEISI